MVRTVPARRTGESVETGSLTDKAYRRLEELIVTLDLPPGTVLSEQGLAIRLNIGRTPIREALQRLARDGLVVVLPRRGVLVSEIDLLRQLRLIETRRVLDRLMAELAADRANAPERARFAEIAALMRQAADDGDDIAFLRLDGELNLLMAQAARNEFAARSMAPLHGLSRRFWYRHSKQAADLPLTAWLHVELATAIASRRRQAAGAASDRLLDHVEALARKTLDG